MFSNKFFILACSLHGLAKWIVTNNKYIVTFKLYVPINYNFYEKGSHVCFLFKKMFTASWATTEDKPSERKQKENENILCSLN